MGLRSLIQPDPRWRGCTSNVPTLTLIVLWSVLINFVISIVVVSFIYRNGWSWGYDSIPFLLLAEVTVPLVSLIHLIVSLLLHRKHKASPLAHLIISFMLLVGWCTKFGISASCNLYDIENPDGFRGYRGDTVCRWWTSYDLKLARGRMASSFLCLLGYLFLASMSGWTLFRVKERQRVERKAMAMKLESLGNVEAGEIHLPDGSHWVNMTVHVPLVEAPYNPAALVEAPGSTRLAEELDSEAVWEGEKRKNAYGKTTAELGWPNDNKEKPAQPMQVGRSDDGKQGQVATSVYEM